MGDRFSSGWKGSKAPTVQSQKLNAAIYPSSQSFGDERSLSYKPNVIFEVQVGI